MKTLAEICLTVLSILFGAFTIAVFVFGTACIMAILFFVLVFVMLLLGVGASLDLIQCFIWWECIATPVFIAWWIWYSEIKDYV